MQGGDTADYGKAQSRAAGSLGTCGIVAKESLANVLAYQFGKAGTLVLDFQRGFVGTAPSRQRQAASGGAVAKGIGEQVVQGPAQQDGISGQPWESDHLQRNPHTLLFCQGLERGANLLQQVSNVDLLGVQVL